MAVQNVLQIKIIADENFQVVESTTNDFLKIILVNAISKIEHETHLLKLKLIYVTKITYYESINVPAIVRSFPPEPNLSKVGMV